MHAYARACAQKHRQTEVTHTLNTKTHGHTGADTHLDLHARIHTYLLKHTCMNACHAHIHAYMGVVRKKFREFKISGVCNKCGRIFLQFYASTRASHSFLGRAEPVNPPQVSPCNSYRDKHTYNRTSMELM